MMENKYLCHNLTISKSSSLRFQHQNRDKYLRTTELQVTLVHLLFEWLYYSRDTHHICGRVIFTQFIQSVYMSHNLSRILWIFIGRLQEGELQAKWKILVRKPLSVRQLGYSTIIYCNLIIVSMKYKQIKYSIKFYFYHLKTKWVWRSYKKENPVNLNWIILISRIFLFKDKI